MSIPVCDLMTILRGGAGGSSVSFVVCVPTWHSCEVMAISSQNAIQRIKKISLGRVGRRDNCALCMQVLFLKRSKLG